MKISILTLFPEMFKGPFSESIIKRAIEKGFAQINIVNIRDFGIGKHQIVDDTPYGGGHGMVMRVDVLHRAVEHTRNSSLGKSQEKVILLTAAGKTYKQSMAVKFASLKHIILICGHYEGVDERITTFIDEEVSIGDFVMTGGEIPAMMITDSIIRLSKDFLKEGVTDKESFSDPKLLEHPQYTKPQEYLGHDVPKVLLSGNHKKINDWRKNEGVKKTNQIRPDLTRVKMDHPKA